MGGLGRSRKTGKSKQSNEARCFSENLSPRPSINLLLCLLVLGCVYIFTPSKCVYPVVGVV